MNRDHVPNFIHNLATSISRNIDFLVEKSNLYIYTDFLTKQTCFEFEAPHLDPMIIEY